MKLISTVFINCPPEVVWAFLIVPENMARWNPKVKRVSPGSYDRLHQGYRYSIIYQMHEKAMASEFLAEFVVFQPPSKLVIRHTGGLAPRESIIHENYELSERDGGTHVMQTISIEHSGINVVVRCLIWYVQRWGRPVGKQYLEILRDLVEARSAT